MKETDYITIQAPMVSQLGLSGNSLIIFALIHGFTKDGEHLFSGSLDYISKWTNISKQSVINNIKQLVEKGYLNKFERIENGVRFCNYSTNYDKIVRIEPTLPLVKKVERGSQETLMGGSQETLPNNNSKHIDKDIDRVPSLSLPFSSLKFKETWETLRAMPKWKRKTQSALQMSLNKLSRYEEEFAVALMENAIAGEYQGVVFQDTDRRYQEWQRLRSSGSKPDDYPESNMAYMKRQMAELEAEWAREEEMEKGGIDEQ